MPKYSFKTELDRPVPGEVKSQTSCFRSVKCNPLHFIDGDSVCGDSSVEQQSSRRTYPERRILCDGIK